MVLSISYSWNYWGTISSCAVLGGVTSTSRTALATCNVGSNSKLYITNVAGFVTTPSLASSTRDLESQKIIPRIAWTKTRLTKSLVIQGWTLVIIQKWSNRRSGTTYALITWKYVKAGIISPGTWAWTSIIISCITAAWCWTSIVGLKDFVELPLTHELIPVGIVCCRYSSKCFYSYWKENGIFCGINKNDPAIHHADISKASHNDPCYNTCLIVISIQYITLDASTSTMTIVATRIASSILLTKEGIR